MEHSQEIINISKALNKLQSEMEFAIKDVQAFKYKYADLPAIWNVLKEPMTQNGLVLIQEAFTENGAACVQTMIIHAESGEFFKTKVLSVPGSEATAHSCGSSITYGKRYQLCALLGIQVDDDDGKEAQKQSLKPKAKPKATPLTDKEMMKWIESLPHDPQDVEAYIKERATVNKSDVKVSAAQMKSNPEIFEKTFSEWIDKQEGK